jgi:glutathione peroxidase
MPSRRLVTLCIWLLAAATAAAATKPVGRPAISGQIENIRGVPVLRVWGSPTQQGYAHGYLLAEPITQLFGHLVGPGGLIESGQQYAALLEITRTRMRFTERYEQELAGVLRGMRDRLGAGRLVLEPLGRPLDVDDLKALQCVADWLPMMCSSFSAWGPATEDGGVITARNLDFRSIAALSGKVPALITVYLPEERGRCRWVNVGMPGLIGCTTGMNEFGVTMSLHDADPLGSPPNEGLTPRVLALREALEQATGDDPLGQIEAVLGKLTPAYGANVHVSIPREMVGPPAVVLEYDGAVDRQATVTRRTADDETAHVLLCTNHFRIRKQPSECGRYEKMARRLAELGEAGQKIGPSEARQVMQEVAVDSERLLTYHTVYFLPDRRRMGVSFAAADAPAPAAEPIWLGLDELLNASSASNTASVYDFVVADIDGQEARLSDYRGRVLLIVNVASLCGATPQYKGLQQLYATYKDRGFAVLGFPANNFGRQEPGTNEQIKEFCTTKYRVTFPMFSKISVKGDDQHPLYRFLTDKRIHPEFGGEITWNFNKFLIDRKGRVIARFDTRIKPLSEQVIAAIERALMGR